MLGLLNVSTDLWSRRARAHMHARKHRRQQLHKWYHVLSSWWRPPHLHYVVWGRIRASRPLSHLKLQLGPVSCAKLLPADFQSEPEAERRCCECKSFLTLPAAPAGLISEHHFYCWIISMKIQLQKLQHVNLIYFCCSFYIRFRSFFSIISHVNITTCLLSDERL